MRELLALSLFGLCAAGCPLPEDSFVLSGRVVSRTGAPLPDTEVTLSRNLLPSETRCDQLVPLRSVRTDAEGRYEFSLIRQEVTAGVLARRFFSVEFSDADERRLSQRFWFPDGDLELGELGAEAASEPQVEYRLDGHVAWRGASELALDRPVERRVVHRAHRWVTVPIDSLGRRDVVPMEARHETLPTRVPPATLLAPGRGAKCPFIDVEPCPLTDGRFVPYTFPPDTPAIVLNFGHETGVKNLVFHGLVLERAASKVRYDFNFFVDYEQWNPMVPTTLDPALFEAAAKTCDEPGAFLRTSAVGVASPVIFRVRFEDAEGRTVPIVSLQELSVL